MEKEPQFTAGKLIYADFSSAAAEQRIRIDFAGNQRSGKITGEFKRDLTGFCTGKHFRIDTFAGSIKLFFVVYFSHSAAGGGSGGIGDDKILKFTVGEADRFAAAAHTADGEFPSPLNRSQFG